MHTGIAKRIEQNEWKSRGFRGRDQGVVIMTEHGIQAE